MTDDAKRRYELLEEGRRTYPAVHPRYQASYQTLYGEDKETDQKWITGFLVRFFIAILLFGAFFYAGTDKQKERVVKEVQRDLIHLTNIF